MASEEFGGELDHVSVRESYARDAPAVAEFAELAADLRAAVDGDVRFDEYAQVLYASDGSIYQARPAGVVEPKHEADVRAAVRIAAEHDVPVIGRGAGSSLAGQAVGPGCLVIDLSTHMDEIIEVDPESRRATVQPGVVQDDLDAHLSSWGLKFAPDPASSNRATIGGGIGNNSTGAHSVRYGITEAYVEELRVILADGTRLRTREMPLDGPEWERIEERDDREAALYRTVRALVEKNEGEIDRRYPELKRCVTGYNLHRVIYENEEGDRVINLSKLIVGSESTLGIVTEATLALVTKPAETALAVYCYRDLIDALRAVPVALEFPVGAVELMDAEVFRLAAESDGYAQYVEPIPEGTAAALMIEYDSELVDDFEAAISESNDRFLDDGEAFEVIEAYSEDAKHQLWTLRKAAIPLLMSLEGDPKPYPFIEDATVPPAALATYVEQFERILEEHGTSAAYFAHAGSGTLHIRPILNLKDGEGVETMRSIADAVTDLVLEHHGAFSGEHGDGMARTEFTPKMYGPQLWQAFKELKTAFDPGWRMHPGNVVYRDGPDDPGPDSERGVEADMREHLRYGPAYQSIEPQTTLDFTDDGGFSHLVELCNGCGTCRQTDSQVMCPTYRAARDELVTTRGRANMLRATISGEVDPAEMFTERFQQDVLDLCVGCKGCKADCPTGVDLAKLKSEVKHQYHERNGVDWRSRMFADIDRLCALGSALAPVSNWLPRLPAARTIMERSVGIAADRTLPVFRRDTLVSWCEKRRAKIPEAQADRRVLLFPDTYTNYSDPEPGKAAVRVLEAAGVHVRIPGNVAPSGRAAYSVGMLEKAQEQARENAALFLDAIGDGWDIVAVEPADAVMFQDEYADLLGPEIAEPVSGHVFEICEYLDRFHLDERLDIGSVADAVTYHGHCHQHATGRDHHAVSVLRRCGFSVDPLDSGCCGMAGSFGYEAEHYPLSKAIGRLLFEKIDASDGERIAAPGISCRSQIRDREDGAHAPDHPIVLVEEALNAV